MVKRLYKPVQNVLRPVALGVLLAYCGSGEDGRGVPATDAGISKTDTENPKKPIPPGEINDYWVPTSVPDDLEPRADHRAVWTGSEMFIWGGYVQGGGSASGERYNPVSDSWISLPREETPHEDDSSYRSRIIWTGSEVLTFGSNPNGVRDEVCRFHGWAYNPAENSWRSIAPLPEGTERRNGPNSLWTGSEVIIWGGNGCGQFPNNVGAILAYNPQKDTWRVAGTNQDVFSSSYWDVLSWTGSEILLFDSINSNGGVYNPENDTYREISTSGAPKGEGKGDSRIVWTWTGSELIVLNAKKHNGARYVLKTDMWAQISIVGAPEMFEEQRAVWTGNEMIVWGRRCSDCYKTGGQEGGIYNPVTDSWRRTRRKGAPQPRHEFTAIWSGSEMIVWGGSSFHDYLNTGGRYRP